ncbi:hypothetical protein [uncultured Sphingomonas sp.]|uniref:phage tail assembly chaperone n=1 Tax=uncultured Sphingomonas sp. TaxID=158754 RepID=UPI00259AE9ED|nr:hypothetical protein [uncultured Sphingomonas sp.]
MGKLQGRVARGLILYAQRLAWLHATPRPPTGSPRAEKFNLATALSRFDQLRKDKVPVQMPPVLVPHIITRWIEIGVTGSNGMSTVPLSWSEITAWQANTLVRLSPWESRMIHALSRAYVQQSRISEDEACPTPWRGEVTEAEKAAEVAVLDAVLG